VTAGAKQLVSVVTAVYNGQDYLEDALRSLFEQDYEPFESIVVDDGSTDRSGEIAQSFPVHYVRQENAGAAAARNVGIGLARGEYVTFLDADDVLPPNKLSLQAGYLTEHPEAGCVVGRQEIRFDGVEPPEWLKRDPVYGDLEGIPLLAAMLTRGALEAVGGFDPTFGFAEDRDLFVRLREAGIEIAVMPEVVLFRRFHGENQNFKPPAEVPLFRSLKAKLDRARDVSETAGEAQ
jgi:glycosyltransferase involved in cell wall biosynthesis